MPLLAVQIICPAVSPVCYANAWLPLCILPPHPLVRHLHCHYLSPACISAPLVILHISTPLANFVHWDTFGGNYVSHCRYFIAWWWCLLLDKCPDLVIIMFWEERLVAAAATYLWSQDGLGVAYWSAQITKCSFSINCNAHLNTYIMFIYDWWTRPVQPDHLLSKKFLMLQGLKDKSLIPILKVVSQHQWWCWQLFA